MSEPKTLVVIIHGLRGNKDTVADLTKLAESCFLNSLIMTETYPHASIFSTVKAAKVVSQILDNISETYKKNRFSRLVLVGHSMGAVLARRVVIESAGIETRWGKDFLDDDLNLKVEKELSEQQSYEWANTLDTLIMMASVSRGWSIDNAKTGFEKVCWSFGAVLGHLVPNQIKPTLFDFRKGSPFIVQTRLRWLEYCKKNKPENRVKLVQFLGTIDGVVPPNDTIDFSAEFTGTKFTQIEVPNTDHSSIIKLSEGAGLTDKENQERSQRKKIIEAVLKGDSEDYEKYEVRRDQLVDELPPEPNSEIKNLVFVVHGIRDQGYWTKKVAGRIKNRAKSNNLEFASRTPSYGYFPILPFLLPWYRRQKVEWLMDNYVEAVATYPNADIHYMGHSNGTYLCARALLDYPTVSFKHIMFAGSVVRPDFPWGRLVRVGKVTKVFNALATADIIVAVFPHGLRHFREFFDLGGAGHVGFEEKGIPNALYQLDTGTKQAFVKGGHSAARKETLWDEIADFIVAGQQPNSAISSQSFVDKQPWISRKLGRFAPAIVYGIACLIFGLGAFFIATNLLLAVVYFYILRFMALRF